MIEQSESKIKNSLATSIKELFLTSKYIRIPAYQRAYSWEEKQCSQFLEDLIEQKGKEYYLGQFLFEMEDNIIYIIDGQQRLTTTILFLSAIAKVKEIRGGCVTVIKDTYLNDIFRTIKDDYQTFRKVTQNHLGSINDGSETISQKRIIEAFIYFESKLSDFNNEIIEQIQNTLESAVISTFYISNKVQATQVFEYQNNRGKELSRFEVIKAYLMHQTYLQALNKSHANEIISDIQDYISITYRNIEAIEGYFSENELLDNYCNLYFNINGNIESIKEKLSKIEDKTKWIKLFFENFLDISQSAKSIVINKHKAEITNLFFVGNEVNWKLVLLTLFHKGDNDGILYNKIIKLLEVLCFKLKLGDYRSDYLPKYSKRYFDPNDTYSIEHLFQDIKVATETGFKWYWNDGDRFKNIITNYFDNEKWHYNRNTIKFVLWQYENELRRLNKAGALLDKDLYESYTIEHISPQNPKNYVYTEEFKKNYLQLAGNLALLTQSQNSKFSNKSFDKKKELFQDTALSSYTEIRGKDRWAEVEITNRHLVITNFIKNYFNTSKI